MWSENYFAPRYFPPKFFGPIITDDVTIPQATYWSPQYFGAKYFSSQYFGRGARVLPQLHEKEASDSFGTIGEASSALVVFVISAGDAFNIDLGEVVPLFSGQGFSVSDTIQLEIDEATGLDKDMELSDTLAVDVSETSSIGVVSSLSATDNIVLRLEEEVVRENLPYYRDKPTKVRPSDFYKDRDK